jgi:hypothetical protein
MNGLKIKKEKMIYDYLFYKSYQLGKWSRNFEDIPTLAGVIWVAPCVMFNLFTINFLVEIFGYTDSFIFERKYKYIFSLSLILLLLFYYVFNGRYKKIIEKYEEKERAKGKGIHPVIVIIFFYLSSFLLLLITGMYRNGDGIFK